MPSRTLSIILLLIVLPLVLLIISALLGSNICVVITVLIWIGAMLILVFLPYYKEE